MWLVSTYFKRVMLPVSPGFNDTFPGGSGFIKGHSGQEASQNPKDECEPKRKESSHYTTYYEDLFSILEATLR